MIAWTRLLVSTAWIMSASLGCVGATPKASTPNYYRSPTLDYADQPRSAYDGEVMGAQAHSPDDWLTAGATTDHLGPGWSWSGWRLHFEPERARAGRGAWLPASACIPRPVRPLSDRDALTRVDAPEGVSLPADPPLETWVAAMAEVPPASARSLSCDGH